MEIPYQDRAKLGSLALVSDSLVRMGFGRVERDGVVYFASAVKKIGERILSTERIRTLSGIERRHMEVFRPSLPESAARILYHSLTAV